MPIITPIAPNTPPASNQTSPPQQDARARAIAKLIAPATQQSQEHPVSNPTQVAPEEMTATNASTPEEGRGHTNEEPAPPVDEATKTKEEPLSAQYAVLARREKALRAKVQAQDVAFKQREADLAAREAKLQGEAPDTSKFIPRERLKEDFLGIMAEEGISYDEITQAILSQGEIRTDPRVMQQIKALEARTQAAERALEDAKKGQVEQQTKAYQDAVNQIRNEAKHLVASNSEFEMIQATNSVGDIVSLIEKTFKADGILMTVEDAAKEIEEYLVDEALRLAKVSKLQKRLAPQASTNGTSAATKSDQPGQSQPKPTLTNSMTSSRPLTAVERAKLAFEGKLNKS